MADNVAITAGSGTTVATDERTIAGVAVHVQRTNEQAGTGWATGQVTPTATAATLAAARDTRKSLVVYNGTNRQVFVGPATVSTAVGFLIPAGAALSVGTTALVQLIVASTSGLSGVVYYSETYDA